ncbi:MAG TPA: SIS domain-containing protein [Nitrososphaera sp.]|nr:SIS domain-containing protein [Nitrososphaera sp.]
MQAEIEYQVEELPKLDLLLPASNCLFVGSGDSYAAGLAAQYFSGSKAICCYPIDIIKNPLLVKRRNLFIVSISGNTQANIMAAKIAKKHGASNITALTARPASRLAQSCDQLIELKYRNTGIATAGTISFTASMIKCISLITQLHLPSNLGEIYNRAEKHAKQVISKIDDKSNSSSISSSCYFILGNGQLHAIAMYGSLKFNEVFGVRAMAYPTEEFCHSPLFSIQDIDQAIVLGDDDDDDDDDDDNNNNNNNNNSSSRKLSKRLNEEGFSSVHVGFKNKGIELLLSATFFIQLLLLKLAQKYGLTSCHFLSNKKLLRVSSDFIYP